MKKLLLLVILSLVSSNLVCDLPRMPKMTPEIKAEQTRLRALQENGCTVHHNLQQDEAPVQKEKKHTTKKTTVKNVKAKNTVK